jgi:peptidoglycan/xylan/chitin deacetylase (PgdA/CDA1 family)
MGSRRARLGRYDKRLQTVAASAATERAAARPLPGSAGRREPAVARRVVLAYHAVAPWRSELAVSAAALRRQALHFARAGYQGLTVSESERRLRDGGLPRRCVVFTFDDGFRSTFAAKRVLDEFGFPGTVFIVTRFASGGRDLEWAGLHRALSGMPKRLTEPLSWDDVAQLDAAGWGIGSHTVTHPLLSTLKEPDLMYELIYSRDAIRSRIGRCDSIAYPYGVPDAAVAAAAERAGYTSGWTLTADRVREEPLMRPRVGVADRDVGLWLGFKTSAAGLWLRQTGPARLRAQVRSRRWVPQS